MSLCGICRPGKIVSGVNVVRVISTSEPLPPVTSLLLYIGPSIEEAKEFVNASMVKDLASVYRKIFTEHESTREYNSQTGTHRNSQTDERSKAERNTLRMILSSHILFHQLSQGISLQIGPTPLMIGSQTVEMALNHHKHLIQTRRLLLAGAVESSLLDLVKVILRSKGPFVSDLHVFPFILATIFRGCDERLQ